MIRTLASPVALAVAAAALVGCADDRAPAAPSPNPCPVVVTSVTSRPPPAPDARTDVALATGVDDASVMLVDATHIYLGLRSANPPQRLVRVPKAGGPIEDVASVDFEIRSLVRDGESLLIAGPDFRADKTHSTIAAVDVQAPHAVRVIVAVDKSLSSIVIHGGTIYAITTRGPESSANEQLFRVDGDRLVEVKRKPFPAQLSHYPLASDDSHLYVVENDRPGIFALRPTGVYDWWIRWDNTELVDVVAGGHRVYVRTRTSIKAIDPDTRKETEIEDLKQPIVAATDAGAVIATRGDIDHIPGFAGAVLWFDAATGGTRVIFDRDASPVGADAEHAYVVARDELIKDPAPLSALTAA